MEVNSHKRLRTHEVQETQAVVAQKAWESVSLEDGYALETRLEGQCIHPGQKRKRAELEIEPQIQQLDAHISALQQAQAAPQQPPGLAQTEDAQQQAAAGTTEAMQTTTELVATLADALREPEHRWSVRMHTLCTIRQLPPQDIARLTDVPGVRLLHVLSGWLNAALQAGCDNRKMKKRTGDRLTELLQTLLHALACCCTLLQMLRLAVATGPADELQPLHIMLQISRSVGFPQAEAHAADLLAMIDAVPAPQAAQMPGMYVEEAVDSMLHLQLDTKVAGESAPSSPGQQHRHSTAHETALAGAASPLVIWKSPRQVSAAAAVLTTPAQPGLPSDSASAVQPSEHRDSGCAGQELQISTTQAAVPSAHRDSQGAGAAADSSAAVFAAATRGHSTAGTLT